MPVFAPLPSNGSVSSSVAGETACPIPNNAIWKLFALTAPPLHQRRSLPRPHQYFPAPSGKAVEIFRNSPKFPLDGLTQMSYGRHRDRNQSGERERRGHSPKKRKYARHPFGSAKRVGGPRASIPRDTEAPQTCWPPD